MPNKISISDMLMIGFDHKEGDRPTLVVGRRTGSDITADVDILNVFKDDEALELYKKLSTPSTFEREGNRR